MILAAMLWVSLLAPIGDDALKTETDARSEAASPAAEFYRAYFLETVDGRYDEALRVYQRLSQNPSVFGDDPRLRTWVLLRLTACHLRSGEHAAARVCLERAREAAAPLDEIRAGIEALTTELAQAAGEEETRKVPVTTFLNSTFSAFGGKWDLAQPNATYTYLAPWGDRDRAPIDADRDRIVEWIRSEFPDVDPKSIEVGRGGVAFPWLVRFVANDKSFVHAGSLNDLRFSDTHPDPSVGLAISRGRSWMKYRQAVEGNWSEIGQWMFGEGEEAKSGEATMAINALATMARGGDLRRARGFLINNVLSEPSPQGWIVPGDHDEFPGYGLALTTLALCATKHEEETIDVVPALVGNILAAQNPRRGWGYDPQGGHNDSHSTVLMLLALAAAERSGDFAPYADRIEEAFDGGYTWLRAVRGSSSGVIGWTRPGDPLIPFAKKLYSSYPPTGYRKDLPIFNAAALLLQHFKPTESPVDVSRDVALLMRQRPRWELGSETEPSSIDFVYWWWGTAAINRFDNAAVAHIWNSYLFEALLAQQNSDGSWPAVGRWGPVLGKTGTTALAVLALDAARPAVRKPETQKK